jgi:hypothetical protein
MRPIFPRMVVSVLLVIFLAACNLPQAGGTEPDAGALATRVASTLAALAQPVQQTAIASSPSPTLEQPTYTQTPTLTTTMEPTNTQNVTLTPTMTMEPTNTPIPAPGTIAGAISGYLWGSVPRLVIVAYGQEPPYYYSYIITGAGDTHFTMSTDYLIPGHFQVVAYDASGHSGGCTINVLVISNQTVNCDITDWSGGYRDKPSGVPSP